MDTGVSNGKNKRKRVVIAGIFVALFATAGWWYIDHRSIGFRDAFNPLYWFHRVRGEDLYDPATQVLFHGSHELKEVALTIDDGPHTPTGDQLLDILKQKHVRATFFVVGIKMKERPDLVQRMVAEGHEVANHTLDHFRLPTLKPAQMRREINDNDINFYRITGRHMDLLRPPGVNYNDTVLRVTKELGYQLITTTATAKDFDDVTPDFIIKRILSRTENGSIILLHDDRPSTVVALPRILDALKQEGYRFVTVSEMLAHLPKPVIVQSNANPASVLAQQPAKSMATP